jgi:hypothetical protein
MRRLLLGLALVACGSGTTEPSFPQGAFPIYSVGGKLASAPIDVAPPGSCSVVYSVSTTLFLGNEPTASIHTRWGLTCSTTMGGVDKGGEYSVHGTAFALKIRGDTIRYLGTVSANRDTIALDSLPDYLPNHSVTGRYVFVRAR